MRLQLSCVLQHVRGKKLDFTSALEKSLVSAVIFPHFFSQAALLSGWIQSYKFSSASAK